MIGLPNQDKTFTITLFMPSDTFKNITYQSDLITFFEDNFPDSIPLIGEDRLLSEFFANKALPMVTVKCKPFYGQGMNCGMEDVLVLDNLLDKFNENIKDAFE